MISCFTKYSLGFTLEKMICNVYRCDFADACSMLWLQIKSSLTVKSIIIAVCNNVIHKKYKTDIQKVQTLCNQHWQFFSLKYLLIQRRSTINIHLTKRLLKKLKISFVVFNSRTKNCAAAILKFICQYKSGHLYRVTWSKGAVYTCRSVITCVLVQVTGSTFDDICGLQVFV